MKKNQCPGLLTRNNSIDCHEYRTSNNLHKKQIFDAIAAASIVNNCSGVDTSKSQVITLPTFTKFLESRQQEKLTDDEIKALIKVSANRFSRCRTKGHSYRSPIEKKFISIQV